MHEIIRFPEVVVIWATTSASMPGAPQKRAEVVRPLGKVPHGVCTQSHHKPVCRPELPCNRVKGVSYSAATAGEVKLGVW